MGGGWGGGGGGGGGGAFGACSEKQLQIMCLMQCDNHEVEKVESGQDYKETSAPGIEEPSPVTLSNTKIITWSSMGPPMASTASTGLAELSPVSKAAVDSLASSDSKVPPVSSALTSVASPEVMSHSLLQRPNNLFIRSKSVEDEDVSGMCVCACVCGERSRAEECSLAH